jgi:hypothetical protein
VFALTIAQKDIKHMIFSAIHGGRASRLLKPAQTVSAVEHPVITIKIIIFI